MQHGEPIVDPVDSLDDPRIAEFRNLKDRELARLGGLFIAEGELVVRRLLAGGFAVKSILLADRQVERIAPLAPPGVPVYSAPAAVVDRIVGFQFHSGVIACGVRRALPALDEVAASLPARATVVVLPEITKSDNLGALLRVSGAFGADAVLLGPRCGDPFYREAIRVSMGALFRLNLVSCQDLVADLRRMRQRWGFQLIATVLDESAEPLPAAARGDRVALLFGNESQGLSPDQIALCDRRVTLPMKLGIDSLNVAVAAAVFLYHFTAGCPSPRSQ